MKKLLLTIIVIFYAITIHSIVFAYEPSDIANKIQNFSPEINVDSGDIERVINDVFSYEPRLLMYYKGYQGSRNSFSSKIKIVYTNQDVDLNNIYIAESKDEFINLITRALLYSENKLYIVAKNMTTESTPINDYIAEIGAKQPIAFMGYRSSNAATLNTEINNYSCYAIDFQYDFEKEQLNSMKRELEQKVCEIVASNIAKDMPPYMKVYIIHNYIVNNCKYAEDYETNNNPQYYTAYGVLVNGKAVCDGYASAAQILFNMCGIENIKITGTSKGSGHAWNLIKLDNDYYHIDTTWDDPVSSDGLDYLKYDYYNITDEEIMNDHSWEKAVYPKAEGKLYNYDKGCELIMNNKEEYTEGYRQFKSIFSTYKPLGEKETEKTEIPTDGIIEPVSVLDKSNRNINVFAYDIINYLKITIQNNKKVVTKIVIIIIVLLFIKNIFRRK